MKLANLKNIALALGLTLSVSLMSSDVISAEYLIDRTVASVNNEIILQSELDEAVVRYKKYLEKKEQSIPSKDELEKVVLEKLILDNLVDQMAKKVGITVSDTDLDVAIENMARVQGVSVDKMMKNIQESGLTEKEAREHFKKEIIQGEVKRAQVRGRVHISDQEIEQLALYLKENYKQMKVYHLAQIVVNEKTQSTPAEADKAARKVKQIQNALDKGTPFSVVAQKYSEASNAIEGGELGEFTISDLPDYAKAAIHNSDDGDVVGPIKNEHGYVFFKNYSSKPFTLPPVEQVKVRHILLNTSIIFDDEMAKNKLEGYRNTIINGEAKFEDIARKYSQDPVTAINGGLMDWMNPNVFDPRFADQIKNLKEYEITKPFKSSFGWHIAQLEGRKTDSDSLEAYKIKAREILYNKYVVQEISSWEHEIREEAYVKIYK